MEESLKEMKGAQLETGNEVRPLLEKMENRLLANSGLNRITHFGGRILMLQLANLQSSDY